MQIKRITPQGDGWQSLLFELPPGDNRSDALEELKKEMDRHQLKIWDIIDMAGLTV